jgi:serine/threonine protein kinase/tetratricopeptide (TPR) repeat protein
MAQAEGRSGLVTNRSPIDARWQQIEALFFAAAELPEAERGPFLDRTCGADTDLRREAESLLATETESPHDIAAVIQGAATSLFDDHAMAGVRFGAYRIEREIGRGGMGAVYLASRADEEFKKRVAIKLVKRGVDTDAVLKRFLQERQVLAGLDHPNIARLLDGGTSPDGRPWFALEYIEGKPIQAYCAEKGLSVRGRCELFLRVCVPVSFAHRNLVIHRDLKPANILVTADGEPKLLDFGIARLLSLEPGENTVGLISDNAKPLTPAYASPEQIRGEPVNTATDVFSLGTVFFQLLTGLPPDRNESRPSEREIEKPSAVAGTPALRKALEGDLDNIVRMATREEPERRYQSVDQFSEDVRRYLAGLPVMARQASVLYRSGKFLRRHRFGSMAAAAVVIAMAAGLGATLWQARVAQASRQAAEEQRGDADRQRLRAEAESRESVMARRRAEAEHAESELQKTAAQTERALAERRFDQVRELARKFTEDVHDAIVPLAGSTPVRKMLVETGLRYYDSLAAEASGNQGLLEEIAGGYVRLGDAQGNPYNANLGDRPGAMASYRKAEALRARVTDDSPAFLTDRIMGSVKISQILTVEGDFKGASAVLGAILKTAHGSPASGDYDVRRAMARAWTAYGDLTSRIGGYEQAIEPYEKVLAIWTSLAREGREPASETAGIALADTKLGETYARMDRSREALAHLRPALEIDKAMVALQPGNMARIRKLYFDYVFMDWAFRAPGGEALGTPEESRAAVENEVDLADRMAAADVNNTMVFIDVATAQSGYGMWLRRAGKFGEALVHFQKAEQAIVRFTAGRPHTAEFDDAIVNAQVHMGSAWTDVGKPEEGLKYLATASDLIAAMEKQTPGTSHLARRRAELEEDRGLAYLKQNDWPRAIDAMVGAIAATEAQVRADPKNETLRDQLPRYRRELADGYTGAKQTADAQSTMQALLDDLKELESKRALSSEENQFRIDAQAGLALLNQ